MDGTVRGAWRQRGAALRVCATGLKNAVWRPGYDTDTSLLFSSLHDDFGIPTSPVAFRNFALPFMSSASEGNWIFELREVYKRPSGPLQLCHPVLYPLCGIHRDTFDMTLSDSRATTTS